MCLRVSSKDLIDKGVLGGRWEEVLLFVLTVLGFVGSDVGEDVEVVNWGGGDGGTGDNVIGAVRDVEEGIFFWVVKNGPSELRGWGTGDNGLENTGSDVKRAWVIPSVVRALEDLKDGGGGICNILLVDVIKGGPGGNRDVGEGRGGDDGGLRRSERHLRQLAPL